MDITPHQSLTAIDWDSFSVGSKAAVSFHHGGSDYITVNSVVGSKLSEVAGQINVTGGGQVYILNPNGMVFHDGALVDSAVIVGTSTLDRTAFYEKGEVLLRASENAAPIIVNGTLTIKNAGLFRVVAPHFLNNGHIKGQLHVAAAEEVRVDLGDSRLTFTLNGKLKDAFLHTTKGSSVEGKTVTMTVGTVEEVLNETIRIDGDMRAVGLSEEGGRIILKGGDTGKTVVSGTLDASGKMDSDASPSAHVGGLVSVTGHTVEAEPTAHLKADGTTGGKIHFGVDEDFQRSSTDSVLKNPSVKATHVHIHSGAEMAAKATTGKGGSVIAIAKDTTTFQGKETLSEPSIFVTSQKGPGGFAEISGNKLRVEGLVDARSLETDEHGHVLFDPGSILISTAGGATMSGSALSTALIGANVTLQTTVGFSPGADLITIDDEVAWGNGTTLSLIGKDMLFTGNAQVQLIVGFLKIRTAYSTSIPQGAITLQPGYKIDSTDNPVLLFSSNGMDNITNSAGVHLTFGYTNYMNIYGANTVTNGPDTYYGLDLLINGTLPANGNYALMTDMTLVSPFSFPLSDPFTGILTATSLGVNPSPYTLTLPGGPQNLAVLGGNVYWGSLCPQLSGASIDSINFAIQGGSLTLNGPTGAGPITGGTYIGLLAGSATNSTITNVGVSSDSISYTNNIRSPNLYMGGLVGQATSTTPATVSISNITNSLNLYFTDRYVPPTSPPLDLYYIGGLVGSTSGSIFNSSSSGSLTYTQNPPTEGISSNLSAYVGGLVGQTTGSTINNSYYSGALQVSVPTDYGHINNLYVGGIAAYANSTGGLTISASNPTLAPVISISNSGGVVSSNGGVRGGVYMGGFVGASAQSITISNSVIPHGSNNILSLTNTGFVGGASMGGFLGQAFSTSTISNCSNAGTILLTNNNNFNNTGPSFGFISSTFLGGLLGAATGAVILTESHNSGNVTLANTNSATSGASFDSGDINYGGVIGAALSGLTSSLTYNSGALTFSNGGSIGFSGSSSIHMGGFAGALSGPNTITGSTYNSGNLTLSNGTNSNNGNSNNGNVTGGINLGGFVGSSTGAIDGTLGANSNTGTVAFTNGYNGGGTGTIGTYLYVGGFAGAMSANANLTGATSSSPVTVVDQNNSGNNSPPFCVGGLVGNTSSSISNSYATGSVSYTENSINTSALYIAGLVAQTTGAAITSSYYNQALSVTISSAHQLPSLLMGGLVAYNATPLSISSSYTSAGSSLSLTNSGTIAIAAVGGLVGSPGSTLVLSTTTKNAGNMTVTNTGTFGGLFYGGIIGVTKVAVTSTGTTNTGNLTLLNGTVNGAGSIGTVEMGGFVGGSSSAIDGTLGANSSSGTVAFTNGHTGGAGLPYTGTIVNNLSIGGFAGDMSANALIWATSSSPVTVIDANHVGAAPFCIAGLVGTTGAGASISNSSYNGALSATINPNNTLGVLNMGGLVAYSQYSPSISSSYVSAGSSLSLTNSGTLGGGANVGGLFGYLNSFNSSGNTYNAGTMTITNTGTFSSTLNYGGVIGSASQTTTSTGTCTNTGNLTLLNGTSDGPGTITGDVSMGGFFGLSAGSSGTVSSSGVLTFTNGADTGPTAILSGNLNVGGFAGFLNDNAPLSGQSSTGVTVTNNSNITTTKAWSIAGLVGNALNNIINSSASGTVSYVENAINDSTFAIGGLLGQNTGPATISNSSYNGALSATITNNGNSTNSFFLGGIAAVASANLTISGSSLGSNSSLLVTNNGTMYELGIGGISGKSEANIPLTISGSSVGTNASLGFINTGRILSNLRNFFFGGVVAVNGGTATLSKSYNQGNLFLNNSGTLNCTVYYGGIIASPSNGQTINQTFNTGNLSVTNSGTGTLTKPLYIGGFAGKEPGFLTSPFTAANNYTTGSININNSGNLTDVYMGGFMGSVSDPDSTISTSYTRTSLSLTNTGTIAGNTLVGSFAGSNSGTIATSYALIQPSAVAGFTSPLAPIGAGTMSGVTLLQPYQMVQKNYFPAFNFGNPWFIDQWLSTPYLGNVSSYIPYLSSDALYLFGGLSNILQSIETLLHDHRTLIPLQDPLKSVTVEMPNSQEDGINLFGQDPTPLHPEITPSLKEEEEGENLFGIPPLESMVLGG